MSTDNKFSLLFSLTPHKRCQWIICCEFDGNIKLVCGWVLEWLVLTVVDTCGMETHFGNNVLMMSATTPSSHPLDISQMARFCNLYSNL